MLSMKWSQNIHVRYVDTKIGEHLSNEPETSFLTTNCIGTGAFEKGGLGDLVDPAGVGL